MILRFRVPKFDDYKLIALAKETFNVESKIARDIIHNSNETIVLADNNNHVIGFISYRIIYPGVIHIDYAVINKLIRGKGISKSIIPHLIQYARQEGIKVISGFVRSDNTTSLQIFENWGFIPVMNYSDGTIIATIIK